MVCIIIDCAGGSSVRPTLPESHRQRDRAVSGRRFGRCRGAADRPEAQRDHGHEFHRREPCRRCRRCRRCQCRREGRPRRLHANAHRLDPHHHAVPQQQDSLRRREGFRADLASRRGAAAGFDRSRPAGEQSEGILRAGAQGAGQVHLRDLELRLGGPSRGRVAQA